MATKRGKGFPRLTLEAGVKVIKDAASHGRAFPKEAFAGFGARGKASSPSSGAYLMKLAALTDSGLITQSKGTIELTDLALKIAYPESEQEYKKAVIEAFLKPEIFSAIYNSTTKNKDLSAEVVGSLSVRQHGINPKHKSTFLNYFISSGEYAGLITKIDKQTIKFLPLERPGEAGSLPPQEKEIKEPREEQPPVEARRSNLDRYEITLQSGIRISLLLPPTLSPNDKDRLKMMIGLIPEPTETNTENEEGKDA